MTKFASRFMNDESGATAIEYGLIAALVAVVLVASLKFLGGSLQNTFGGVGNQLKDAGTPAT